MPPNMNQKCDRQFRTAAIGRKDMRSNCTGPGQENGVLNSDTRSFTRFRKPGNRPVASECFREPSQKEDKRDSVHTCISKTEE